MIVNIITEVKIDVLTSQILYEGCLKFCQDSWSQGNLN